MKKIKSFLKQIIKNNSFLYIAFHNSNHYRIYCFNKISGYSLEKKRFFKKLDYHLNLKNSRSFNEKIVWKKIYDRNPLLPSTADKFEVRTFIRKKLGDEIANKILIPLLYVTNKPETIPFDDLTQPYIIKPNNASGRYIIVENNYYNKKEIIKTCNIWLKEPFGKKNLEWAYQPIKRKIIIEELLREEYGVNPREYKFFMINGKCCLVHVIPDRFNDSCRNILDAQWNCLPVKRANHSKSPILEKPGKYFKMLKYAEQLSASFDFVRIDFYYVKNKIYVGELTHYPASGTLQFEPISFDFELGEKWKLTPKYWKNNNL